MPIKLPIKELPAVLLDLNNSYYCLKNKLTFDLVNDDKALICNHDRKIKIDPYVLLSLLNEIITSHNCASYISINRSEGTKSNLIHISFSI